MDPYVPSVTPMVPRSHLRDTVVTHGGKKPGAVSCSVIWPKTISPIARSQMPMSVLRLHWMYIRGFQSKNRKIHKNPRVFLRGFVKPSLDLLVILIKNRIVSSQSIVPDLSDLKGP